ncbi:MAG: hypothetical protein RMM58_10705 [Chloroflexota bacterium]|nr:hypothetical protein [Dehalococcoidia bacterium]MDW8254335.1 hypothetical protein [Chloroflexota bacterium]
MAIVNLFCGAAAGSSDDDRRGLPQPRPAEWAPTAAAPLPEGSYRLR